MKKYFDTVFEADKYYEENYATVKFAWCFAEYDKETGKWVHEIEE